MSRGFAKNLTKHHLNIVTNSWRRAEWDYGNIKRLKELKEIFFLCSKNKQKSQRQSRGWDGFLCYYLQQFIFHFTAFEHSKLVKDISKWIHSLPFVCLPSTTFFSSVSSIDDDLHEKAQKIFVVEIYLLKKFHLHWFFSHVFDSKNRTNFYDDIFDFSSSLLISNRACHHLVLNSSSFPQFASLSIFIDQFHLC